MSSLVSLGLHLIVYRTAWSNGLRQSAGDAQAFANSVSGSMNRAAVSAQAMNTWATKMNATWNATAQRWQGSNGKFIIGPAAADLEQQVQGMGRLQAMQERVNTSLGTYKSLVLSIVAIGYLTWQADAVKQAVEFQKQMLLLQTQAQATGAEVASMTDTILKIAPSLQFGPVALSEALFHIESVGYRAAKALDILTIAAQGARVGNADLSDTTNALVATLISGIGGIDGASQAMGVLNGIVGSGNLRMEELVTSMKSGVLATAKAFGVNIQQFGAALASLTDQGVPAAEATTRLRIAIALLGAPTAQAKKQLETIGLTSRNLADVMRSPAGLIGALQLLKDRMDAAGLDATQQAQLIKNAFGGARSSAGILALIGNIDLVKSKLAIITKAENEFGQAVQTQSESAAAKFNRLQASVEVLTIKLGDQLLPYAIGAADALGSLADHADILIPIFMAINVILAIMVTRWLGNLIISLGLSTAQFFLGAGAASSFAASVGLANTSMAGFIGMASLALAPILLLIDAWQKWQDIQSGKTTAASATQDSLNHATQFKLPFFNTWVGPPPEWFGLGPKTVADAATNAARIAKGIFAKGGPQRGSASGLLGDTQALVEELNKALSDAGLPTIDLANDVNTLAGDTANLQSQFRDIITPINDLMASLYPLQDEFAAVDSAMNKLADDFVNKLYGLATLRGQKANLQGQIADIGKQLQHVTSRRQALILKGQLAQLNGELFKVNLAIAEQSGPQAAIDFLLGVRKRTNKADTDLLNLIDTMIAVEKEALRLSNLKAGIVFGIRYVPPPPSPRRASGGSLSAGQFSTVGERGIEGIIPQHNVQVLSNNLMRTISSIGALAKLSSTISNGLSSLPAHHDLHNIPGGLEVAAGTPAMPHLGQTTKATSGGGLTIEHMEIVLQGVGNDVSERAARKFGSQMADTFRREIKRVPVRTVR